MFDLYQKLLLSYENCTRRKPKVKRSSFHLGYEQELFSLAHEIHNRGYRPKKSSIFVVTYPKPREIIAAHIRDRVVHHLIYDYMAPYWEKRFFSPSYTCRPGKGPLKASLDLRAYLKGDERGNGRRLYALKLDIQNFFPTIDLEILRDLIFAKLHSQLYRYLCQVTIFHRPTKRGHYSLVSDPSMWQLIPQYKSLFYAAPTKGLVIGNLTSQFFAKIYLNHIDQYITHKLSLLELRQMEVRGCTVPLR
jgi:hypothetical protein